jgi:hypothetical protein
VFAPVRVGTSEFLDGGVFTNQPLHAVLADEADAIIVVLVSPSSSPPMPQRQLNLFEMAGRLLEIANWRDLQTELRALPADWAAGATPGNPQAMDAAARVCVIEPEGVLPGGLYGFSPANSAELRRRGERDAWRALAAAGWLTDLPGGPDDPSFASPPRA